MILILERVRVKPIGTDQIGKAIMASKPSPAQQLTLFGGDEAKRHANRRDLKLLDIAEHALADDGSAISFLHRGFCHCSLPLRRRDDKVGEIWSRSDGKFTLSVSGGSFRHAGKDVHVGLPYGPKARLLCVYLASEVKNPSRRQDDRTVHFGRITNWLTEAGVRPTGGANGSIQATKQQLFRLAFATFTMTFANRDATTPAGDWFHREGLIEGGCLAPGDIEKFADGDFGKLGWPDHVTLTHNAFERMREQAIPIATQRLTPLADNAAALDFFVWLSYRLPRIPEGEDILVSWGALCHQFGDTAYPSSFRRAYEESLRQALAAYPEAKVEITDEGLVLRHSDPSVPRRTLVAIGGGKTSK